MKTTTKKAATAPDPLPEDMRDPTTAYLIEQAEKFSALQDRVAEGSDDRQDDRTSEQRFRDFLRDARPKCVDRLQMRQGRK